MLEFEGMLSFSRSRRAVGAGGLTRIPNERDYGSGTVPTRMNGHGARYRAVATDRSLS